MRDSGCLTDSCRPDIACAAYLYHLLVLVTSIGLCWTGWFAGGNRQERKNIHQQNKRHRLGHRIRLCGLWSRLRIWVLLE